METNGPPATGAAKIWFIPAKLCSKAKGGKPAFEGALKKALRLYREHRSEVERDSIDLNKEK